MAEIGMQYFFKQHGFEKSQNDACLYKKGENFPIIVLIWVDDIVIAAKEGSLMTETKNLLKERFKMKDLGAISFFLGIQFKHRHINEPIILSLGSVRKISNE